jgi:hypothetical protein
MKCKVCSSYFDGIISLVEYFELHSELGSRQTSRSASYCRDVQFIDELNYLCVIGRTEK